MSKWVTTWAFGQRELATALSPDVSGCTVCAKFKANTHGNAIRLVFKEEYSKMAVEYLELALDVDGNKYEVTFEGAKSFILQQGQQLISDRIPASVNKYSTISLYIAFGENYSKSETSITQSHSDKGNYCMADFVAKPYKNPLGNMPFTERLCGLKEIQFEVDDNDPACAVAAFGDSIVEMASWFNPLQEEISKLNPNVSLLNLGIGGNRLLKDTNAPAAMGLNIFGKAGLKRLKDDIAPLQQLKAVILAIGLNDIAQPGGPEGFSPPKGEICTASELIEGLKQAIAECRSYGCKIAIATITPFKGFASYDAQCKAIRAEVNDWIRNDSQCDYVLDFAKLFADPSDEEALIPGSSIGDMLHPNPKAGLDVVKQLDVKALLEAII